MEYKYNMIVNGNNIEHGINIPKPIFDKISTKFNNIDEYLIGKITKYQWEFDNEETRMKIINEIEIDLA